MTALFARLFRIRYLRSPPAALRVAVLLFAVLCYGSTGYRYFELSENPTLSWSDGLWYSVVTVTTVGYGDYYPKTAEGRFLIAVPMMFVGIGLLGYILSMASSALVQAKTKELHGMSDYKRGNHLVIINFPSLAKVERLFDELENAPSFGRGHEVILIDEDLLELPAELARRSFGFVRGNPTRDETLIRADVDRASYAVVLARRPGDPHSDAENVAITLAIKGRGSKVHTVVECVDFATQELLRKAGCDRIVCTSRFDAHFLSHELLNPGVQEVVEELTSNLRGQQIYITSYDGAVAPYAKLADLCRKHGHLPIGVRRGTHVELNVGADFNVESGDGVVSIGAQRLPRLES